MASRVRVTALAVALCLGTAGCAELGLGGPSYDEELSVLDEVDDASDQRVTLSDGSEVAVGYVGGGRYAVQFREPEGEGWTAPETVVEGGDDLSASGLTLDALGDTASVRFSWYAAGDDEREEYARTDAAVCHNVSCTAVEGAGSPMLAEDGAFAATVLTDDDVEATEDSPPYEVATWSADSGEWTQSTVEGPPLDMSAYLRPALVLLDDGRLATVRTEESDGCRYELWAGEPRSTELAVVDRTKSLGAVGCVLQDVTSAGDAVTFWTSTSGDTATFSPTGEGWTDNLPDSTLLGIAANGDGRSGIAMTTYDLDDGSTTAVGSPDGRRILTQYRAPREREWTRPTTVARAPAGQRCRSTSAQDLTRSTDVVYLVACWPEDARYGDAYGGPPPTTGFALGSTDGRRWQVEPLDRPAYTPSVQLVPSLAVARGSDRSLVWRKDARDFEVVDLPLPNPAVDALGVVGDEAFRVTGNPEERRPCRPRWDVAPLDATSWSYGGPIRPIRDHARGPGACEASASDDAEDGLGAARPGRRIYVGAYIEDLSSSVDGVLVRPDGRWRLR